MDDAEVIELSIKQRQALESAFLNAFSHDNLKHMLRLKMGIKIDEEMNFARGLRFVVTDLIDIALSSGWLIKLLLAAKDYKPGNIYLKKQVDELAITVSQTIVTANVVLQTEIGGGVYNLLEKIIKKQAPFIPFIKYTQQLLAIGRQIARVEIPKGKEAGTAWLVGPNLALTAYHVIESIHKNKDGLNFNDLTFRFDYTTENGVSRTCAVNENWLIDHSPYSICDLQPCTQDPTEIELDYALIELVEHVGDDLAFDSKKRGWIELPEYPIAMSTGDSVLIPQHPNGRPLELAFGAILKYNNAADRVRYDTNTEPGSSGSPCLDVSLQPFALHHASGPANNLNYNQGVPLREIIKLMKKRSVTPFWKKL